MPRTLPQHALARRALAEEPLAAPGSRRSWARQTAAVLGVGVLGLGVAGSAALTGSAQGSPARSSTLDRHSTASLEVTVVRQPGVPLPSAFDRRDVPVSRSATRPALGAVATGSSDQLAPLQAQTKAAAQLRALAVRDQSLERAAEATSRKARDLKQAEDAKRKAEARAKAQAKARAEARAKAKAAAKRAAARAKAVRASSSSSSDDAALPIRAGYRIAARFGDTGSWSRYHTGIDFSAAMGTEIDAVADGVVTHAGSGSSGWAGTYVTVRHADGKSTLYAHMSSVSVSEGERVDAGQRVGAVGMTGRTFGPHVHFELYPAGVTPSDPYDAINPAPWLQGLGVRF